MRYEIIEPVENVFGMKLDNGSWNGVIGRIQKNEADLGVIALYVTYDRFQVVKFTVPVTTTRILFVVSRPNKLSKIRAIIRPFSFEVRNEINQDRSSSLRIFIGIWLLVTTVLISAYSGVLFSYITYPAYAKVPKTIEELSNAVRNREYSCGTLSHSAFEKMMMDATKGMVSILGDYIRNNPDKSFSTVNEGIQYALQHKHAYIISDSIINTLTVKPEEQLIISEDSFLTYSLVYPININFKFEKKFNTIIRRLVDGGVYEKLKQSDLPQKRSSNREIYLPLCIDDICSALILLLCGYGISFITLFVETVLNKRHIKAIPQNN
ncbi:glutamate receptor ionotropic, delta-1-like [Centruroides sculpturatus]|uniref:glutamate receptor ionotropic, delta-1-like n=1 Tax=Centruroides sculpturatus TaxID=218467 RepID=UPI000C6DCED1|nr:glutamate receptor ionotropic, delta-1-like [Centruroides sculpturatus]